MSGMKVENREGRLFVDGVDTGLPFRLGSLSAVDFGRIWKATGRDPAFFAVSLPSKHAVRRCQCGALFVGGLSRGEHCRDCYKARETAWRRRALANRGLKRREARQGKRCERCGKPIEAERSTRRFCSDFCRVRSWRAFKGSDFAVF